MAVKPLAAQKVTLDWKKKTQWFCLSATTFVMWLLLIASGVVIILNFWHLLFSKGLYDADTLQLAIYLAVGSYAVLLIDKHKIRQSLNVKDVKKYPIPVSPRKLSRRQSP